MRCWLLLSAALCANALAAQPLPPPSRPNPAPQAGADTTGVATPGVATPGVTTPPDGQFLEFLGADDVGDAAWWEFLKKAAPRRESPPEPPVQDARQ